MAESADIDRTPAAARAAIDDAYAQFCAATQEDLVKRIITRELVAEVLSLAWRHQFDEDRAQVRRKLQELVGDQVTELEEAPPQ